ncbi:MAG: hypothetical protein V4599_05440 [Verrucomicrobiota bacterium]
MEFNSKSDQGNATAGLSGAPPHDQDLPGQPVADQAVPLFASNPQVFPEGPASAQIPNPEVVKSGAEFGMTRFCEQAFVNPESASLGSVALLRAFDDSGLWLASLVQPAHLVAELRQHCCQLTRVVVTQWTRQGETHKLVRLAEALLEAQPPVLTHEAGQIMALLTSLLGVLRPVQAPRWLAACRPLLLDSVDPHLLKEAAQWVEVGQLLLPLPQEDRLFWNRRLREPESDWDWESNEALDALHRLAPLLPVQHEILPLFQAAVPRCWWALWRAGQGMAPLPAGPRARSLSTFVLGLITGIGCMMLAGWWVLYKLPLPEWVYFEDRAADTPQMAGDVNKPAAEPPPVTFAFHAVEPPIAPPARPLPAVATPVVVVEAPPPPMPVKQASVKRPEPPPAAPVVAPPSPAMQLRLAEAAKIAQEMPEIGRLHSLVKNGSLREATPHIQGRTMVASQGSRQHRALLQWLMLDPPLDPAVQEMVVKSAVRVLDSKMMYETLQLCLHPDSPNLQQARECASLLLALKADGLNESERQKLAAASSVK